MKTLIYLLFTLLLLNGLAGSTVACSKPVDIATHLTIVHTNDTHGHLENVARRATAVETVRNEVGDHNLLLLDAGDVFSGTAYFTLYQGEADVWFMNYMQYSATCLGNHEFDKGPAILAEFADGANFTILCSNLDFSHEITLAGKIAPWTIIERGGEEYGIFGLTTEETAEISSPGGNIIFQDPLEAARDAVHQLEAQGVDRILAITHIGWDKDLELAREVEGIDIIIGGHSHTLPDVYPVVIAADDTPTLVTQAGAYGSYLGRLNIGFDEDGVVESWDGSQLVPVDDTVAEDPVCAAQLAKYKGPLDELMKEVIGITLVELDGERNNVRTQETNLGNLIADAMLDKAKVTQADIAITNSGGIRTSIPAGEVTRGQVINVLPFDNYLVAVDLTGEQIIAALENGVSKTEEAEGRFPQVSGLKFTWDPSSKPGSRIVSVELRTDSGYQPIDESATYRVVTNDYVYQGRDGYTAFEQGTNVSLLGFVLHEVVAEYIQANSPLSPHVEGRICHKSAPCSEVGYQG
jgi:2',3'-cyclic-nucleotide 2'-phosphodiesterase (5'-nucleotidase family)